VGRLALPAAAVPPSGAMPMRIGRRVGIGALAAFALLLVGLPLLRGALGQPVAVFDSFYRSGALVFGGGHVVLPLLYTNVVEPGWVPEGAFTAGYGAAQALPGPLFAFAGYLGAISSVPPNGVPGGVLAVIAIFLPGALLVLGALPFWDGLRSSMGFRRALLGTNAAVVGILAAALYTPIWTSAIGSWADVVLAAAGLGLLLTGRVPPIAVVGLAALAGQALALLA
jgi:chromate transporter